MHICPSDLKGEEMKNTMVAERIPHKVDIIDPETSSVTFIIPAASVRAFVAVFSSFAELFRSVDWKQRTHPKAIAARNASRACEIDLHVEKYETAVISTYKEFLSQGNTPRESLSLTATKIGEHFVFSSYDMVKSCLQKNKLLKNTGFYKSRHKFD
jgi:hypothetical protein